MNTPIYFLLTFGYICLLIWGLILAKKKLIRLTNLLLLVMIGLVYDNFIIAIGGFVGEGELLEGLSYPRYWLHALFTPTLILFAYGICRELGLAWTKKTAWKAIFSLLAVGLIVYELFTTVMGLELKPTKENGILTYNSVESTSPVMVIIVILVLLIVGIILKKNFHYNWLLIGSIVTIIGNLLAVWITTFPLMNIIEFILILSLVITKHFQVRESEQVELYLD